MRRVTPLFGGVGIVNGNSDTVQVDCIVIEDEYIHKVSKNHKIMLCSTVEGFGQESFYMSDLE